MSREIVRSPSRLRYSGDRTFVLWIGLLASMKNPLDVVDIARMMPEVDFVMIGWSYDKAIANRLQTERPTNLYYLGPVSNNLKEELIEKCCVGITTSKYEGFGLTPLEFLRAGKPVLAYPLEVFKEVYGNLITYVNSREDFVKQLRRVCKDPSCMVVDAEAVRRRLARYDLANAASNVVERLGERRMVIFTEDVPKNRDDIAGYYLLQWRLWELMKEKGAHLKIFTNGEKYSNEYHLADSTIRLGPILDRLRENAESLRLNGTRAGTIKRKLVDLSLRIVEPLLYVHKYIVRRREAASTLIIATGDSQILGALIIKCLFRSRLVTLIHDMRLFKYGWAHNSFLMKTYNSACLQALLHADLIMLVSETMRRELLHYYPYQDRLMVIWGEQE